MLFLLFLSLAYLGSSYHLIVPTFSYVDVCNPNYIQFLSINSGTLNTLFKFNKNSTNSKKFKNTTCFKKWCCNKKFVPVNVVVLKAYQMCIIIFAFFVHLEPIKNLNKKDIIVNRKFRKSWYLVEEIRQGR